MAGANANDLLVELLVEELPPKALRSLGQAFAATLKEGLVREGLAAGDAVVTSYATPRRLAAHVSAVLAQAADRSVRTKLMPVAVALDANGQPTPALSKKLAALGVDASVVPSLERAPDGKAQVLFLDTLVRGATLAEGLQRALDEALTNLPIPKVMSYQLADGWTTVNFVRPAHGLVALHGATVVAIDALGHSADRVTRGHRFEAATASITIRDAASYASQLAAEGAVIASFDARGAEIQRQLRDAAAREHLAPIDDVALVDEVTALVERPYVVTCSFDSQYLAVPQECLILTMKANQKYFPLLDAAGRLTNRFLVVSNIRPADASRVVEGNERVVRPRLADAKFFFDQDRKKSLASRVAGLDKVVYHGKLGSQGARVERVRTIARAIAGQLGGAALTAQADRAALLAKADLLTDMVGEFPELQGVMGGYYARHDGEAEQVAFAIEDHYKPRFSGDALPRGTTGVVVALADKLETLAGLFGIGQVPSGDKDPFALRRHALGVIRLLIERELPLDVAHLVGVAFAAFPDSHGQAQAEVGFFLRERLTSYLRDAGYTAHEVDAVVEAVSGRWADVPLRLTAVRAFARLPEAAALASANKRVGNILRKSATAAGGDVDVTLLREHAESTLYEALLDVAPKADAAFGRGDFTTSLCELAVLRQPVDAFFDQVMVNAEDARLRANRLALMAALHAAMNRVADLSKLAA